MKRREIKETKTATLITNLSYVTEMEGAVEVKERYVWVSTDSSNIVWVFNNSVQMQLFPQFLRILLLSQFNFVTVKWV